VFMGIICEDYSWASRKTCRTPAGTVHLCKTWLPVQRLWDPADVRGNGRTRSGVDIGSKTRLLHNASLEAIVKIRLGTPIRNGTSLPAARGNSPH